MLNFKLPVEGGPVLLPVALHYLRTLALWHISLYKHDVRLASSSASCEHGVTTVLLDQPVGRRGDESGTRGTEGVTNGQRTTPVVQLLEGDGAHLHWHFACVLCKCVGLQRFQVRNNLHTYPSY
jgi:hypothetical protein